MKYSRLCKHSRYASSHYSITKISQSHKRPQPAYISTLPLLSLKHSTLSPTNDAQGPDTIPDCSRLRKFETQQRRPRCCRLTKKSPQFHNTVLKYANILVNVTHYLPPHIQALLPAVYATFSILTRRPHAH